MVIPERYQCSNWLCTYFSHYLNPLGNWNEPLPYPEHRKVEAEQSILPPSIWWLIRNPFHNFCHYWVGITPLGNRYEWLEPELNGWERIVGPNDKKWQYSYWKKGNIKLPFWNYEGNSWQFYIGWLSRGNFGIAFRRI